jgi:hypothetical protein
MNVRLYLIFLFAFTIPQGLATQKNQFQHWYPEYRIIFRRLLRENCTEEYAFYLAGHKNRTRYIHFDIWIGSSETSQVVFPTASCILNHTSGWVKFNMAAAAVLLGLTPTILAALGPSVEETSTLFVIAQRHILGLFIAAGSPSIYPFRLINYREPIEDLINPDAHIRLPDLPTKWRYAVMVIEFLLLGGAVVYNALNSYQLGMRTNCVYAPQYTFLPLMWAFLGILAHVYGSWALWARVLVGEDPKTLKER